MKITFLLIISFLIIGCDDDTLTPLENAYGLTGRILDESGNTIDGAKIYYMFNYNYFPTSQLYKPFLTPANTDSFGYSFNQNFPNPVYNSSFVRYSLGSDVSIELTIAEKKSGKIKYSYSNYNYYGLYQHYFNNLVDSLQLENGCYVLSIKAITEGTTVFYDEKTMFVLSDLGAPNYTSDKYGRYFFDYNNASIGDTIDFTYDGENIYSRYINSQVNFLVKKDGYIPEVVNIELYKTILINQDIILKEEEQ